MHVIHCPCCPEDAKPSIDSLALKRTVEEMLGDDLDGIAAAFNDHRL